MRLESADPQGHIPPVLTTVDGMVEHITKLYKTRNDIFMPSREQRIGVLYDSVFELESDYRKGGLDSGSIGDRVARIGARFMAVADSAHASISRGLAEKCPARGCYYCRSIPCLGDKCDKTQPHWTPLGEQYQIKEWGFDDYQNHLKKVYGEINSRNGIDTNFYKLREEVEEIREIETRFVRSGKLEMTQIIQMFEEEIGDGYARLIAICNLLGTEQKPLSLQRVLFERYWPDCLTCKSNPCHCRGDGFDLVRDPSRMLKGSSRLRIIPPTT